ncbi:Snipper [Carabus blaptoides fortunei]
MNTKELARKLRLIETIHVPQVSKNEIRNNPYSIQNFQYLLVLDYESTCWDRKAGPYIQPEIIEFPAVLYKIKSGEIVSKFQQYVMPTENYKLSEFCQNLTGITQDQVDNGVLLATCLMLFSNWIKELEKKYRIVLPKSNHDQVNCIFVTWSNWDLGTCLANECKRKRIKKPEYFSKWCDLRALYREFYNRRPQGLKGVLNEVGLEFSGREHCGLHDARNTAYLAGRMIQDGALIRITKELDCCEFACQ